MPDWPHSPIHRVDEAGTYIVTAGTYGKLSFFRFADRLTLLCERLLSLAAESNWQLQAWAVFPNHYHFIAISPPNAKSLKRFLARLHAGTAKELNELDSSPGRRVWFEYWDTRIVYERAYLARLNYVHNNAVKHGLVRQASRYPWCSAGWFESKANPAFFKTVMAFPAERVKVRDDFAVSPDDIA
jgi:putative transposase